MQMVSRDSPSKGLCGGPNDWEMCNRDFSHVHRLVSAAHQPTSCQLGTGVDLLHRQDYSAPMGDSGPSINITADAIEYAVQKFLKLVGQDRESKELTDWFKGLQQTAFAQTSSVHCLGMRNPVPFDSIYQPNRILVSPDENAPVDAESSFAHEDRVSRSILRGLNQKPITVEEFLKRDQDALIFGFPGWGKTTFLHHIFRSTLKTDEILPVLISLRRPTAIDDLERYVVTCSRIQKKQHRACTLLLVDGYDEVSHEQRKRVAEALLKFQGQWAGKFYLTCREYYQVAPLSVPEVRLELLHKSRPNPFCKSVPLEVCDHARRSRDCSEPAGGSWFQRVSISPLAIDPCLHCSNQLYQPSASQCVATLGACIRSTMS